MAPLHDALVALGATVEPRREWGTCRSPCQGPLARRGRVMLPGDVSSQYITALMLIAPYVAGRAASVVDDAAGVAPYLQITGR